MKRIIAALVLASTVVLSLASCAKTPESLNKKATKNLNDDPYKVEIKYEISSKDPTYNSIFSAIDMEGSLEFDGSSYKIINKVSGVTTTTILVDETVYMSASGVKTKVDLTKAEKEDFLSEYGTTEMELSDFETVEMVEDDGQYEITCSAVKDDSKDEIEKLMNMDDTVTIDWDDVTYVAVIEDNKFVSQELVMPATMKVMGISISFTMEITFEYDYDSKIDKIEAPSDADKYKEGTFDELMGE